MARGKSNGQDPKDKGPVTKTNERIDELNQTEEDPNERLRKLLEEDDD